MLRKNPSFADAPAIVRTIFPRPEVGDIRSSAAWQLPWVHCLGNDAFDVGGTLRSLVTRSRFQETVDDRTDEHGSFELDPSGLAAFKADFVQRVNLPRR